MRNAIISVSDKTNIEKLARFLLNNNYHIYSTGGTLNFLRKQLEKHSCNNNIKSVEEITNFPEILDGRVKTLHPKIYGGLLANLGKESHQKQLEEYSIKFFDLVVVNLYPFEKTCASHFDNEELCIENIDIGGVSLIRAASKNYHNVSLLTSVSQYDEFMSNFTENTADNSSCNSLEYRKKLATQGFFITSEYDNNINSYYGKNKISLKYGINPHQEPSFLTFDTSVNSPPFRVLSGVIGYINVLDAIHGWLTVREVEDILNIPAVISMKHTSPAGLAIGTDLDVENCITFGLPLDANDTLSPVAKAFAKARNCDPLSSFGDFIICSSEVDVSMAKLIKREVSDGIMAPSFTEEALEILKNKKAGRYIILEANMDYYNRHRFNGWDETKSIYGITFHQPSNNYRFDLDRIQKVYPVEGLIEYKKTEEDIKIENTRIELAKEELQKQRESIILSYSVLKYAQSNNVCMVYNGQVIGMGTGQQNRVDCVRLAGQKARKWLLRRHPLTIEYLKSLSSNLKRQEKINMVYRWIDDNSEMLLKKKGVSEELVLGSDGFFPFPDNILVAQEYGVKYVIQPGGSQMDRVVADECRKNGIIMATTGSRVFYH